MGGSRSWLEALIARSKLSSRRYVPDLGTPRWHKWKKPRFRMKFL
jgi:hypothetical protein